MGEPREEDATRDDRVVDGDEVAESSDDYLFGDAVSGDGHRQRGCSVVTGVDAVVVSGAVLLLFSNGALDAATAMEGGFGVRRGGACWIDEGACGASRR